jgi:hypothetical protein
MAENDNSVQPGHWYFCFQCPACRQMWPFLECTPDAQWAGSGRIFNEPIACPVCGTKHFYEVKDALKLQASSEQLKRDD